MECQMYVDVLPGAEMACRSIDHILQYGELTLRQDLASRSTEDQEATCAYLYIPICLVSRLETLESYVGP